MGSIQVYLKCQKLPITNFRSEECGTSVRNRLPSRKSDGREIKKRQGEAETVIEREGTSKQEPNRPV